MYYLLIILLVCPIFSKEVLFYHESPSQWKVTGGVVEISPEELIFKGDASADLTLRDFEQTRSGHISFYLQHEEHARSSLGILQTDYTPCHCAVKLRMGSVELELGERWFRVQTMDSTLTVDSVLVESESTPIMGRELFVSVNFQNGTLTLSIDDVPAFTVNAPRPNLHDLTISSFMGSFTISSFLIETDRIRDLIINEDSGFIDIPATFKPEQFNSFGTLKNHHLITWDKGEAAGNSLFTTLVSDKAVYYGLKKNGALPGNNLTVNSWKKRHNKKHSDPDIHAEGTPLELTIIHGKKHSSVKKFL